MDKLRFLIEDDIRNYIKSHHFAYWDKYVLGVNMSRIGCDVERKDFPKYPNSFYMRIHENTVSYDKIRDNNKKFQLKKDLVEESKDVVYHSSLIAPILIELGRLVNHRLFELFELFNYMNVIELKILKLVYTCMYWSALITVVTIW